MTDTWLAEYQAARAFDSRKHPRDERGEFTEVLGQLGEIMAGDPKAARELHLAAKAAKAGDQKKARHHLGNVKKRARKKKHHQTMDEFGAAMFNTFGNAEFAGPGRKKLLGPAFGFRAYLLALADDPGGAEAVRAAALAHEKVGHTGQGLWHHKNMQLPAYIQHIANDLISERGIPESQAVHMAVGLCQKWARGGGGVTAQTQAKAAAAVAEWERLKAQAKATRSTVMATGTYDSDGLDESWDGEFDLPDLTGLSAEDLDAAAGDDPELAAWLESGDVARAAKLGSGARFAALKAKLAGRGVKDPGALAAHIGRKKFGKQRFHKLASAARARKSPAAASRTGELYRLWPLEDIHIVRRAEGDGSGRLVEAYAAVFDTPAEIRDHEGHYEEEIDRGAFTDVLRDIGPDRNNGFYRCSCFYNHGMTIHGTPAERFSLPLGVPRHVSTEGRGLLTRTEYADTPLGEEVLELVRMGAIRSQSFTGGIIRSDPMLRGPGDRYRKTLGGALQRVRRLVLGLREYGPTPLAAYSGAEIMGVRMQLPGGFEHDGEDVTEEYTEDAAALATDGDGYGDPPGDGDATRSTGNRLYRLRTEQALAERGIELP